MKFAPIIKNHVYKIQVDDGVLTYYISYKFRSRMTIIMLLNPDINLKLLMLWGKITKYCSTECWSDNQELYSINQSSKTLSFIKRCLSNKTPKYHHTSQDIKFQKHPVPHADPFDVLVVFNIIRYPIINIVILQYIYNIQGIQNLRHGVDAWLTFNCSNTWSVGIMVYINKY